MFTCYSACVCTGPSSGSGIRPTTAREFKPLRMSSRIGLHERSYDESQLPPSRTDIPSITGDETLEAIIA